jgi:hypothetical protein
MTTAVLNLYIGMDDEGQDKLCLDLSIPERDVNLWESTELNTCGEADFIEILGKGLNEASLWSRFLSLRVKIDAQTLLEITEDYSVRATTGVHELLKEFKKGE